MTTLRRNGKEVRPVRAFYKLQRVAKLLDMSPQWVRERIRGGDLKAFKFGKDIVVEAESLDDFLFNRQISQIPGVTERRSESG